MIEEIVPRWLDPARFRRPARRPDGRSQAEVNRSAKLKALRIGWTRRGLPWDQAAAEALVDGRPDLVMRHLERHGVYPGPWGGGDEIR